jgi:hypothetical protein
MGRPKSFIQPMSIDRAGRAHSCQHSAAHVLQKGDVRLKLRVDRSYEHFCRDCAIASLQADILTLQLLVEELRRG